ncbi:MAG TPA: hypothetical protein VKA50_07375 [Gammaproteobacteria bacterium]|nr:hypothetical protein [Gammaproteobacteria bacterium]
MNLLTVDNTAQELSVSPFIPGMNGVAVNFTAGALVLQGSPDGTTYTTLVTVPAGGMIEIPELPTYIKVSTAATVYVLA